MWLWFAIALLANFLITRLLVPGPEALRWWCRTRCSRNRWRSTTCSGSSAAARRSSDRFVAPITYPPAESSAGAPASKQEARSTKRGPPRTSASFTTTLPTFADRDLEKFLIDNKVEISAEAPEEGSVLSTLLLGSVLRCC
jgi:cell division protease FtsH